jgi:purine nucleosidase
MAQMASSERVPVLLDTDIGSDIDDAVCLAYLLRQPRCELLGVTTVSGKPRERASLADAVCCAAGRTNVPIVAGCERGILLDVVQPECPQSAILPRFRHRPPSEFGKNDAVEFLRAQIRRRPNEITLLAIGPMTNLGILFALEPELAMKLKRVVLMCGIFREGGPGALEWNALCDPIATAATYRAKANHHLSIGLDVTMKCQMPCADAIEQFRQIGGPLEVVAAMTEVWAQHRDVLTFHDPLAAAVIFEPEICRYEQGQVSISLCQKTPGATLFDSRAADKPHHIAVGVDPQRFFDHYFSVVSTKQ